MLPQLLPLVESRKFQTGVLVVIIINAIALAI